MDWGQEPNCRRRWWAIQAEPGSLRRLAKPISDFFCFDSGRSEGCRGNADQRTDLKSYP